MLDFLKENSTVILIIVGIIILVGVIFIRNRLMTANESFNDNNANVVCDDVTGICQRIPNGGVSEANMEAAQKKMETEIMEESQEIEQSQETQDTQQF
jgi:hypothetical protein